MHQFIIDKYLEKRRANVESKAGYAYTTPRTLLGIIRLSQAMARLRLSEDIEQNDVDEALRLMDMSQSSVLESLEEEELLKPKSDNISAIFLIITEMCRSARNYTIKYSDLEKRVRKNSQLVFNYYRFLLRDTLLTTYRNALTNTGNKSYIIIFLNLF